MIATLLVLLLALLDGSPIAASPPSLAYRAAGTLPVYAISAPVAPETMPLPSWSAGPAIAASQGITSHVYLPFIARLPFVCQPVPGVQYGTLVVPDTYPPGDPPPEDHPDLNLSMRGYEVTSAYLGLVHYDEDDPDPNAPQLYTLFADHRVPAFTTVYQVYDWNWPDNERGSLLSDWDVTLAGMGVAPGEILYFPDSGYNIGNGYEALVLYATEERITLKYTREDNVVEGYTIHVEDICVEPSLLALYRERNDAGRGSLPALRGGQPIGRARGYEFGVALRDWGDFLDPRSDKDWWQGK
jgi:hypothetical protein